MKKNIGRCNQCLFSLELTDGDEAGRGYECRKVPPALAVETGGRWVTVRDDEWCGEFQESHQGQCDNCTHNEFPCHRPYVNFLERNKREPSEKESKNIESAGLRLLSNARQSVCGFFEAAKDTAVKGEG